MRRGLKRRKLTKLTKRPIWPFWHKDLGRARSGQAIIEYTVLFAVIAAVTFVGTAVFFQRVCRSEGGGTSILKNYFNSVVQQIK